MQVFGTCRRWLPLWKWKFHLFIQSNDPQLLISLMCTSLTLAGSHNTSRQPTQTQWERANFTQQKFPGSEMKPATLWLQGDGANHHDAGWYSEFLIRIPDNLIYVTRFSFLPAYTSPWPWEDNPVLMAHESKMGRHKTSAGTAVNFSWQKAHFKSARMTPPQRLAPAVIKHKRTYNARSQKAAGPQSYLRLSRWALVQQEEAIHN